MLNTADATYTGRERRRHPRLPLEVPVEILLPGFWSEEQPSRLLGQTINLSEGGVCFLANQQISAHELVLHLDYEGMGAEYVLVTIVSQGTKIAGSWQYHCQIERTLSHLDPMSVFS